MLNRSICDALEEMRNCLKTNNFSYLSGLIEEVQSMANRMEASLYDKKDYERMLKNKSTLKKEIKELEERRDSFDHAK